MRPVGAFTLLSDLRHRGFVLEPKGDRIRVAPCEQVTPEVRELLSTSKSELLSALTLEERLLGMTLHQFEREGRRIEVRVPWLSETLWFVPTQNDVQVLLPRGVNRGRIWTAAELAILWRIPDLGRERVQNIARVKKDLDAEIESIETADRFGNWVANGR